MFFLATPHRGCETAKFLNNIVRASASKQCVSDIRTNSPALTTINDEFNYCIDKLHLWSFYETIKTRMRMKAIIVVERHSATIGMHGSNGDRIHQRHLTASLNKARERVPDPLKRQPCERLQV